MSNKSSSLFTVFFFFFFFLLAPTGKCLRRFSREPERKSIPLFIFGDSFLDAGNNNYINTTSLDQANFWPYGETFFRYPTGRFSDGRLISDFLAEYANLPLIPPFLQPGINRRNRYGSNFASAGAGALVETFQGSVINLKTQLKYYKKVETSWRRDLGKAEANKRVTRSVYLISIGTNDYISPFLTTNSTLFKSFSSSQYVGMVIGNISSFIKEIYKHGGKKFGIINMPELGCFPAIRILRPENAGGCLEEVSMLARLHNKALSNLLIELETLLKDFKYSLFDFHKGLKLRMNHPSKYGFKKGEEACCGSGEFRGVFSCGGKRIVKEYESCENPNDYVFFDSLHLTEKAYEQFAYEMWHGKNNSSLVIGSYNLKTLFQIP